MPDIILKGCRPEPLASYLKALGVLRLVAEQKDPNAQGFWQGEHFVLRSTLEQDGLAAFFREEWRPTPILAPWNGGSGFYPKDNAAALDAIAAGAEPRFVAYREAISVARALIDGKRWTERPADEDKAWLLQALRARWPDEALAWLDAAVVLGEEKPQFPPLLGTGGNDGRLDFSNNFMQRVIACIDDCDALTPSLFGASKSLRFQGTMGMYAPASDARSNPWDFVFLLEGSLLFAGAATRRLASAGPGTMAFPFHARAAGGSSSLAPTDEDKSRDELWLPLWSKGSTLREIHAMLAEGRAKVGVGAGEKQDERDANTALDFARAVSRVGTDRGIASFARVGFHERNGLAFFATPLGRYTVGDVGAARLLDELDAWLTRYRRAALSDRSPATVRRAAAVLEDAMFAMVGGGSASEVLLALSQVELTLARSIAFTENAYLSPLPTLSDAWQMAVDDTAEARLGRALGARPGLRRRFLPLDPKNPRRWGRADDTGVVFGDRSAIDNLHALLLRDALESQGIGDDGARGSTTWADLSAFIDGTVDDELVERWAMATTLLPPGEAEPVAVADDGVWPPATYAVLKLVLHGALTDGTPIKRTPMMLARACSGDAEGATRVALQRLNAVGRPLPVTALVESPSRTRRIAAALAFPLSWSQRRRLERMVLSAATSDSHEELQ